MQRKVFRVCERLAVAGMWRFYPLYQRWMDLAASVSFARRVQKIGPNSSVRHPYYLHGAQHIQIGVNFVAGPGLRIEAWDQYFGFTYRPEIIIGNDVCINYHAHIGVSNQLRIGNDVLIGSHVLITDHAHGNTSPRHLAMAALKRPLVSRGPTIIEDNVFIGEGACILGGVRVGKNAVIGANAVVTRDVASGQVVVGAAGKPIPQRPDREQMSA